MGFKSIIVSVDDRPQCDTRIKFVDTVCVTCMSGSGPFVLKFNFITERDSEYTCLLILWLLWV